MRVDYNNLSRKSSIISPRNKKKKNDKRSESAPVSKWIYFVRKVSVRQHEQSWPDWATETKREKGRKTIVSTTQSLFTAL